MACVVVGCKSHSSRKGNDSNQISCHRFPEDHDRRQTWIDAISRKNWTWKKHSRICSRHFEDYDFIMSEDYKRRRLKPSAVPSLHLLPDASSSNKVNIKPVEIYIEVPAISDLNPVLKQRSQDISSTDTVRHTSLLQRRINQLEQALEKTKRVSNQRLLKINALRQKERRLKKKNTNLSLSLIEFLEGEKIERENLMMLDYVRNNKIIEQYLAKEQEDETRGLSMELKKFAASLHFFSPRAYNLVQDELRGILPHPETISKWYQGHNCNLGFTTEALDSIKHRIAQNKFKLYCALSIDEDGQLKVEKC